MSDTNKSTSDSLFSKQNLIVATIGLLVVLVAVFLPSPESFLAKYPKAWTVDLATPLGDFFKFMARQAEIGPYKISELTRGFGTIVSQPYEWLKGAVATGFTFYHEKGGKSFFPPMGWMAVTAVFTIVAEHFGPHQEMKLILYWAGINLLPDDFTG